MAQICFRHNPVANMDCVNQLSSLAETIIIVLCPIISTFYGSALLFAFLCLDEMLVYRRASTKARIAWNEAIFMTFFQMSFRDPLPAPTAACHEFLGEV